jgi:hypothetical protein
MKKKLAIPILIALFSLPLYAQIDTSLALYSWELDAYHIDKLPASVDTNLAGFQIQNPIMRNYISASTLGNLSSPSISNIFTDRNITEDFTTVNVFYPFMKKPDNTTYINTRRPFTRLTYLNGGSSQSKDEVLDVLHSQNVNRALNFGLHFTTQDAKGQYFVQRIKNNSFRFFSSYDGKIYSSHISVNYNRISADENGGVLYDSVITDTVYGFSKEIPTLFGGIDQTNKHQPDVYREIRNISLFTIQEASFKRLFSSSDTTDKQPRIRIFYPKLAYIFSLDRTKVKFVDTDPSVGYNAGLYPGLFINQDKTTDSLFYWKMQNAFRIQFQGRRDNHYFIDLAYDLTNYSMSVFSDTANKQTGFFYQQVNLPFTNRQAVLYNTHLSSGFSRIFANALKLDLYGRYYLAGYQFGDFRLTGDIELILNAKKKPVRIKAGASNELLKPGFLYGRFLSNNFIWNQPLKQTSISNLSGDLNLLSNKFVIQADYYLLHNMVYFDTAAFPRQFQRILSVLSVVLGKEFRFWKVHSNNHLAFQQVSEPDVLSLPALALHSSNYLEHEFYFRSTEGRLLTMLGFDLFYNTSYYANAYMPALATFYQQKEKQLGNNPYLDVFLNVRLKRVRFFVKYEHFNSGWLNKNFFTVLHYPKNQASLNLGLSWTFYN